MLIGRRFARRAGAAAASAAIIAGGLFLVPSSAVAAPQTDEIPLAEVGDAPTGGTLDNQVQWSVTAGQWHPVQGYALFGNQQQLWFFDRPVDVRFGLAGLNVAGESFELPADVVAESIHPSHTFDPQAAAPTLGISTSCPDCESVFVIEDVEAFAIQKRGTSGAGAGPTFMEVTYNLPVVEITSPEDGGTYTVGDGTTFNADCVDGTGETGGAAQISGDSVEGGHASIVDGAPIDQFGPGAYTIDVGCADEHGAVDTAAVAFVVEPGQEPEPEPVCTEDGFQVFEPPHIDLHPPSNGVSDGVHDHTEPGIETVLDPLVTALGLPALQPIVHDLNCEVVVTVEDTVDEILIPVVTEVKKLLGGLFG